MKKNNKSLEDRLRNVKFTELTESESAHVWESIASQIERPVVSSVESPSPYFLPLPINFKRQMIPLLIGALLFVGVGGTVAADSAAPGDFLYSVDRGVENVRLAFTGKGNADLRIKLAEERLLEVDKIIKKARLEAQASASTTATSTATSTKSKKQANVALGVNTAISFLNSVQADLATSGNTEAAAKIETVIDRLETKINDSDVRVMLKKNDDLKLWMNSSAGGSATSSASSTGSVKINTSGNKSRIEIRDDGERYRIEIKDNGDFRIKSDVKGELTSTSSVKIDDDDEDDDDDDDDDDDKRGKGNGNVNTSGSLKIQIR